MSLDIDVEQDYFNWLCMLVEADGLSEPHDLLLADLYNIDFYSLIPHDESRATDGLALREEYYCEVNYPRYVSIKRDCSVLEMLVALARRMDYETGNPDYPTDTTVEWFWKLLDNLGLFVFSDRRYRRLGGSDAVGEIVENLLERDYKSDGEGGLFPLKSCIDDQTQVEIWDQMHSYLLEYGAIVI